MAHGLALAAGADVDPRGQAALDARGRLTEDRSGEIAEEKRESRNEDGGPGLEPPEVAELDRERLRGQALGAIEVE